MVFLNRYEVISVLNSDYRTLSRSRDRIQCVKGFIPTLPALQTPPFNSKKRSRGFDSSPSPPPSSDELRHLRLTPLT